NWHAVIHVHIFPGEMPALRETVLGYERPHERFDLGDIAKRPLHDIHQAHGTAGLHDGVVSVCRVSAALHSRMNRTMLHLECSYVPYIEAHSIRIDAYIIPASR